MRVSQQGLRRFRSSSRTACPCFSPNTAVQLSLPRSFAVFSVGEGWTGAFGTGRLDEYVSGHLDEEEADVPVKMYDGPVKAVAVGWGHTAVVTADSNKLLVAGRPHDFAALLRLQRLPPFFRDYSARVTLSTMQEGSQSIHPSALIGRFVSWLIGIFGDSSRDWDTAREYSIMPVLTEVELPDNEIPVAVACSAGFTACISESGALYAFGLNGFGQCGIGVTSNNVWEPTRVTGLNADFADRPRAEMEQSFPIQQVALGLQHGVCVNTEGELFAWGKGERGQLGQEMIFNESHMALPIRRAFQFDGDSEKPNYLPLGKIQQIATGMLHSAALTTNNQVMMWGKNVLPTLAGDAGKIASDSRSPVLLKGLPAGVRVERVACGSHHTALLLQDGSVWAVGISSDTTEPIHEPVQLIPPGLIDMPVRQFAAHMDRTTVVGADGRQVLQVHLWKDLELRHFAIFTPSWVDRLLEEHPDATIREVHRSWVHSVVVTD